MIWLTTQKIISLKYQQKSPKGFALSPQERNTLLEQKIKSEGWSGMFDRGAGGDTATLFEPLDVGKRYDLASGVLLSGLAAKPTYNAMDDLFAGGELASNLVGSTLLSLGEESLSGLKALGTGDPMRVLTCLIILSLLAQNVAKRCNSLW